MQQSETRKLEYSDIGYHGTPIDALTREELLEAFVELAQAVVCCSSNNNQCKAVFTTNQD